MKQGGLALILFLILQFCALPGFAQDKPLPEFSKGKGNTPVESPDWSQFKNQPQQTTETPDIFFKRCVSGTPTLPPEDQEALCACMAANMAVPINPVQVWATSLTKREKTPYEHFLTDIYADCAWVEMNVRANDECYRQTRFRVMFHSDRAYDRYCTCYSRAAVKYLKSNGRVLLESYIASPAAKQDKESKPSSKIIMDDTKYNIYMDNERQKCLEIYTRVP